MIAIGHSSIGAMVGIGVAVATPGLPFWLRALLAFTVGVASHYPADWIPHGHYHVRFKKNVALKTVLIGFIDIVPFALFLIWLAWLHFGLVSVLWLVGFGIGGALTPDVIDSLYWLGLLPKWNWLKAHRRFHVDLMHWHSHPAGQSERSPRPLRLVADWWLAGLFAAAVLVVIQIRF